MLELFDQKINAAYNRIKSHVLRTPLYYSHPLSRSSGANIYLKLESEQITGSFKLRGAANKILSATAQQLTNGIVSASTGNHGIALATVAFQNPEAKIILFVPKNASVSKIEKIKDHGVQLKEYGNNASETEVFAKNFARENGLLWVSPYNDEEIIAGQGTIGIEISEQLPQVDSVFVTVGGGGLISGISAYLKSKKPQTQIIGCMPERSPEIAVAIEQNRYIAPFDRDTISDGSAGGYEEGTVTLDFIRTYVDSFTLVSEEEIQNAMRLMFDHHHKVVEGAAGVALAAFMKTRKSFVRKNVVVVICGGNINRKRYLEAISE